MPGHGMRKVLSKDDRVAIMTAARQALGDVSDLVPVAPKPEGMANIPDDRFDELVVWLQEGGFVAPWLRRSGFSRSAIYRYFASHPGAKKRYEEAIAEGADALADRVVAVATTPDIQTVKTIFTDKDGGQTLTEKFEDSVLARKLAVTTMLELLKHRAPDKYGTKTTQEVRITMSNAIAEARSRLAGTSPNASEVIDTDAHLKPDNGSLTSAEDVVEVSLKPSITRASRASKRVLEPISVSPAQSALNRLGGMEREEDDDDWL